MIRLFVFQLLISQLSAYNYLVFCPLYAHSHHVFLGKIADTLADAGHNVTFFSPIIQEKYKSIQYVKNKVDVVYMEPNAELTTLAKKMDSVDFSRFWDQDSNALDMIPNIKFFQSTFEIIAELMNENRQLLDELKSRKFDVFIYEVFSYCALPLFDYLEIPTLTPALSITHMIPYMRSIGEPALPSILSNPLSAFGDKMSFTERSINAISQLIFPLFVPLPEYKSFKDPNTLINIEELEIRSSYIFTNSNPYLDFPRPVLTKTVEIGGITMNLGKKQELTDDYIEILNQKKYTILISFGSVMLSKDMPDVYRNNILKVISEFQEVNFIWKYETDFETDLPNLFFRKWVPQTGLLAHPNLTAFLTHSGLGSTTEISYSGKPCISVPIFADQMRNAKMMERHGGTIVLEKYDLANFDTLKSAISRILFDKSFHKNAEKLQQQLLKQPIKPKELLVKHAEFAAEFGELPSLDPYSRQMSFVTYFMLDLIFVTSLFLFVAGFIIHKCCGLILRQGKQKIA